MTRCGQGWELSCSHGRPYYTREPTHKLPLDDKGMPTYSITPNKKYSEAYEELFKEKASADIQEYYVDILKVKLHCDKEDCIVTLDGKQADLVKNGIHSFMVAHENSRKRYQDPNRVFPFVSTLKEAFSFTPSVSINPNDTDPMYAPQTMVLDVDGDKVNIKVYPGDYYSLIISLPPARVKNLKRGVDPKKQLEGGKKEDGKAITDNVAKKGEKKGFSSTASPQGNPDRSYSIRDLRKIKDRLKNFFVIRSTETNNNKLEFKSMTYKDENNMCVIENDNELTKLVNGAPVNLLHNGESVTLSSLESVFVTLRLLDYIVRCFEDMAQSTWKVGWFFEISTEFIKGSGALDWGFAELESDYMVECYRAFGTQYTIVEASFEICWGIKAEKSDAEAVVYFKLLGKLDLNCGIKNPPISNVLNTGNVQIGVTFTATAGVRGKCGEVLSLDGGGEVSLEVNADINLYYRKAQDHLVHATAILSPIEMKLDFKAGNYRIISCSKKVGKTRELAEVRFPADDSDLSEKDKSLDEKEFLSVLANYVKLCRKNKLDVHMKVTNSYTNIFGGTSDKACEDNDVARTIIQAMKNVLRNEYDLLDFTERSAEGIIREVATLAGASRFGSESKRKVTISIKKFHDLLGVAFYAPNHLIYSTDDVSARCENLLNILVNYRSPCKVFKRKLELEEQAKQKT